MEMGMYLLAAKRMLAPGLTDKEVVEMCALGLVGELGEVHDLYKKLFHKKGRELDKEKVLDELGDIMWYIANIAKNRGLTLTSPEHLQKVKEPISLLLRMSEASGYISAMLNDYLYSSLPMDNFHLTYNLNGMIREIASLAVHLGSSLDTIMYNNVEKLKERHGITFQSEYTSDSTSRGVPTTGNNKR